jgi:hypothetical protein
VKRRIGRCSRTKLNLRLAHRILPLGKARRDADHYEARIPVHEIERDVAARQRTFTPKPE